jgi:hypothetical protein
MLSESNRFTCPFPVRRKSMGLLDVCPTGERFDVSDSELV